MGSENVSELIVKEGSAPSSESIKYWRFFVDSTSLVWLAAFTISLLAYDTGFITVNPTVLSVTDVIILFTLPVFIADLMLKYYRFGHSKAFFKKYWVDIIFVVPYFRVFRVLRMVKILGLVRLGRIPHVWLTIVNVVRAVYRALKLGKK